MPGRIPGKRVALRPLAEDDLSAYGQAFVDDPELGAALGFEHDPDEDFLRDRPARVAERAAAGDFVEFAIADPGDDRLLGVIVLHSADRRHQRVEVGFWLVAAARGRGLATEAVGLAVDWAFAALDVYRVEMFTAVALPHEPDVVALAERLGFRREGIQRGRNLERGRRLDTIMLAVLRPEWAWPPTV